MGLATVNGQDTIWYENFDNLPNGATMHAGEAGWGQDLQGASVSGHFAVNNQRYEAHYVNTEVLWVSEYININYFQNVGISVDLAEEGTLESTDSVNVYYRVNDGPPIPLQNAKHNNDFSPVTATASGISGEKLQIIAHFRNGAEGEIHILDNVVVTGEPVAMPSNLVWYETFNDLANNTVVDNGSSAWTRDISAAPMGGSGYFTTRQYRFLGRYLNGEAVWTSEVVDIAAHQSVDISADLYSYGLLESSDYIRVYYRLNGGAEILLDNGEINGTASDLVTAYKNGLSGASVQFVARMRNTSENERQVLDNILVKSNGLQNVIWYEDFNNLPDGITMHAGEAAWDRDLQGASVSGHFQVNDNKYEAHYVNSEVLWVSEYINIKYYQNVGVQVDLASLGILESTDSINVYYRVDDGTPIPLQNAKHSGNFSPVTATASGISGEKLQIIAHFRNGAEGEIHTLDNVYVTGGPVIMPNNLVWYETFNDLADNTTVDNGSSAWSRDISSAPMGSTGYFTTRQYRFLGRYLNGEAVWTSEVIDITGKNVDVAADIYSYGAMESSDYIRIYYKLNGGAETLLNNGTINGPASNLVTAYKNGLTGNSVQLVARMLNTAENERHLLDNILVTFNDVNLDVEATGGVITCTNNTVALNATASIGGVTYNWSGPNGFTSTLQNPEVADTGIYTLTVINPANSDTATDTAMVGQNITAPGATATASGPLDCAANSVTISGSSGTAGVTYGWSGPDGFNSTQQNISVSTPGTYILVTSNPVNGCTGSDTVQLVSTGSVTGTVWLEDFQDLSDGTTTDNGTTAWTLEYSGSGDSRVNSGKFESFGLGSESVWTSALLDISSLSDVSVSIDVEGEGSLNQGSDYFRAFYVLDGGSEVTFIDHDVNGAFSSTTTTSPTLNGNTLQIVVRQYNTGTDEIYRFDNVTVTGTGQGNNINATATVDGILSCANISVTITGGPSGTGLTYSWAGPDSFSANTQNITVSQPGNYTLTVTNEEGCSGTVTTTVSSSTGSSGTIWLEDFNDLANGTKVDNGATAWSIDESGLNTGFMEVNGQRFLAHGSDIDSELGIGVWTSQVIDISSYGDVVISLDIEGEGSLDNGQDYLRIYYKLDGGVETLFIDGEKEGAFNSTTVISPVLNGNSVQIVIRSESTGDSEYYYYDNIKVEGIGSAPGIIDVTATVDGELSCSNNTVTITGGPSGTGITYNWTGPGSFSANTQNITVSQPGDYTLTVTNSENCSGTVTTTVSSSTGGSSDTLWLEDFNDLANGTTVDNGATAWTTDPSDLQSGYAEVQSQRFEIQGTSNDGIAGQGIWQSEMINIASYTEVTLSVDLDNSGSLDAGQDYIRVYYKLNGGAETLFTDGDKNGPFTAGMVTTPSITGNTVQVVIRTYSTGDSEIYFFDNVRVVGPGQGGEPVTVSVSDVITCNDITVTLTASPNIAGYSYSWNGPNGFVSNEPVVDVNQAGTYTLIVEGNTGCVTSDTVSVEVVEDSELPDVDIISGGMLTCSDTVVTLVGKPDTLGITYAWEGPGGFGSNLQTIDVSVPGKYRLVADNGNGCSNTDSITIGQDIQTPDLQVQPVDLITCADHFTNLSASSATPGVKYEWKGPSNYVSTQKNAVTSIPGEYVISVTNVLNGCTAMDTVVSLQNIAGPGNVVATVDSILSCSRTSVMLSASSDVAGASYTWSGPDGFSSAATNPAVTSPGFYKLTVTDPANGCKSLANVLVEENLSAPTDVAAIVSGKLTCTDTVVTLTGSYTSSGNVTFTWIDPNGFTSSGLSPKVSVPGTYTFMVTDTVSGCSASANVVVEQDKQVPQGLAAAASDVLGCVESVILSASSTTNGVVFNWTGPQNFAFRGEEAITSVPGDYEVKATNPVNGCTAVKQVTVTEEDCSGPL